jgi:hypothetical protein
MCILERVPFKPPEPTEEEKAAAYRATKLDLDPPPHLAKALLGEDELHVRYLRRPPLRTPYNKVVSGVLDRITEIEPVSAKGERRTVGLAIDATGVGRGIRDMIREELSRLDPEVSPHIRLTSINVTGGNQVTMQGGFYGVPKRDLISAGIIALQDERLRIGKDVENRDVLIKELLDYRMTINLKTGHDTYEPWREGEHDDLLFAVCMAAWASDRFRPLHMAKKPKGFGQGPRPRKRPWYGRTYSS